MGAKDTLTEILQGFASYGNPYFARSLNQAREVQEIALRAGFPDMKSFLTYAALEREQQEKAKKQALEAGEFALGEGKRKSNLEQLQGLNEMIQMVERSGKAPELMNPPGLEGPPAEQFTRPRMEGLLESADPGLMEALRRGKEVTDLRKETLGQIPQGYAPQVGPEGAVSAQRIPGIPEPVDRDAQMRERALATEERRAARDEERNRYKEQEQEFRDAGIALRMRVNNLVKEGTEVNAAIPQAAQEYGLSENEAWTLWKGQRPTRYRRGGDTPSSAPQPGAPLPDSSAAPPEPSAPPGPPGGRDRSMEDTIVQKLNAGRPLTPEEEQYLALHGRKPVR